MASPNFLYLFFGPSRCAVAVLRASQVRFCIYVNRDRDAQGLVLCEAKTECNEPGAARAEGIAHKIIPSKNSSIKKIPQKNISPNKKNKSQKNKLTPKIKKCDRDTKGLVRRRQPSRSEPGVARAEGIAK